MMKRKGKGRGCQPRAMLYRDKSKSGLAEDSSQAHDPFSHASDTAHRTAQCDATSNARVSDIPTLVPSRKIRLQVSPQDITRYAASGLSRMLCYINHMPCFNSTTYSR